MLLMLLALTGCGNQLPATSPPPAMEVTTVEMLLQKMSGKEKTIAEDKQGGTAKKEGKGAKNASPTPALTKEPRE